MSIPIKVKVVLRDLWDKKDGSIQTNLTALEALLGYEVEIKPNWPQIISDLSSVYDDKGLLAQAVASAVNAWTGSLVDLLNGNMYPPLTEALKARDGLIVYPEVHDDGRPSTTFSKERDAFLINLPNDKMPLASELVSIFQGTMADSFEEQATPTPLAVRTAAPSGAPARAQPSESNAEPSRGAPPAQTHQTQLFNPQTQSVATSQGLVSYIPDFKSLPKPDDILSRPPYYLMLYASRRKQVEVECSHSPTLVFLADYLKKWVKINHQSDDKSAAVIVQLHQAAFGLGLLYDRLTLFVDDNWDNYYLVTPTVILALVEGVLGYERVWVEDSKWTFRKTTELKKF